MRLCENRICRLLYMYVNGVGEFVLQALEKMAQDNNGTVICPKTKEVFPYKKIEKVYVM